MENIILTFFRNHKILILLTLTAYVLRVLFINSHDFWFDEQVSVQFAQLPFDQLIAKVVIDTHPPLYYILLHFWLKISDHILFLRLLSVFFSTASLFVSYLVLKILLNRKIALVATILLTVSPLSMYYATEIRMYSLVTLEIVCIVYSFLRYLEAKKNIWLISYTLLAIASSYTHYLSLLILGSMVFYAFICNKGSKQFWTAQAVIALAISPWLGFVMGQITHACWCFPVFISFPMLLAAPIINGLGLVTQKDLLQIGTFWELGLFGIASVVITFFAFSGLRYWFKNKSYLLLSIFLAPLLVITIVSFLKPIFSPRLIIIILPFYFAVVVTGIMSFKKRQAIYVLLTIILLTTIMLMQFLQPKYGKIYPTKTYLLESAPLL